MLKCLVLYVFGQIKHFFFIFIIIIFQKGHICPSRGLSHKNSKILYFEEDIHVSVLFQTTC